MSRTVVITTPECIQLEYPLAGLASRFLALVIDTLLQTVVIIGLLFGIGAVVTGAMGYDDVKSWMSAFAILGIFVIVNGYFIVFETLWSGQTPGKRAVGIRVLSDSGHPLDFRGALLRNIMRVVDFLPGMYAVGVSFVLFHPQARRVGDLTAGTIVIREREAAGEVVSQGFTWQAATSEPESGVALPLDLLAPEHVQLIETFLRRRPQLDPVLRRQMADQIAIRLRQQLQLTGEAGQWASEKLLEELMKARARRAGL